jgi:DnaK suppressor protein
VEHELKLQAHIDAELSRKQLEKLANCLTKKRHELTARVDEFNLQIVAKDDCITTDAVDAASMQENRLRASGMVEQHRLIIAEIDAALRRLETGRYGVSETSGEPISFARLMLVPWARTGID